MTRRDKLFTILKALLFFINFFLAFSMFWARGKFGNITLGEMLFTLRSSREGVNTNYVLNFTLWVILPTVLLDVLYIFVCRIHEKKKVLSYSTWNVIFIVFSIFFLIFLGYFAETNFNIISFIKYNMATSSFIEENYVSPESVEVKFPEEKRNLIYILMESGETSNMDKENGGLFSQNYIPEMTKIAKENVSFSQSDLLQGSEVAPGSGWTMAGMVSQFSGVPLKVDVEEKSMDKFKYILPGLTTMGEILENEGYKNYFMIGSDARFAGRDTFMKQHGNYEIFDYYTALEQKKIPEGYKVNWGFEDLKLYEFAKEKLLEISKNDEPFNFILLTVDTHFPKGYVCENCGSEFEKQYANVWACASNQLNNFIEWLKQQDFYDNTTIVISGDHKSMEPTFYNNVKGNRYVYNAIVNAPVEAVKEKNRKFTTLDMFPTTLSALGVTIEGDRLGLGTNLFSSRQTIPEEIGYDTFFQELIKKSTFYDDNFIAIE